MTKVIFDISMSLDGFVTASNVRPEEPMGDGGQRIHEWAFSEHERNCELLAEAVNFVGTLIAGRRTYDLSVPWWGADGPAGPARVPVFVVTHAEPGEVPEGGVYTFVSGGIESALEQAKAAAGDKDVAAMGVPPGVPYDVTFGAADGGRREMTVTEYGYTTERARDLSEAGHGAVPRQDGHDLRRGLVATLP